MERELTLLNRGEMTFDRFVYLTGPYWRRVAGDLRSRWEVPPAIGVEDIVQELLLGVWTALDKYEAGKSPIKSFVLTRAIWSVKRWLHRERGAWGWQPKEPSRFPLSSSDTVDQYEDPGGTEQERAVEVLERMRVASTDRERVVMERIARCPSVDLVAADIYSDPDARLTMKFDNQVAARQAVYRTVLKMARTAEGSR